MIDGCPAYKYAECTRAHKQTLILSEALRAVALSKDHAEAVMFACNALDWHILPDAATVSEGITAGLKEAVEHAQTITDTRRELCKQATVGLDPRWRKKS